MVGTREPYFWATYTIGTQDIEGGGNFGDGRRRVGKDVHGVVRHTSRVRSVRDEIVV